MWRREGDSNPQAHYCAPVFETGALPLDYPSASQIRLKLGRPLAPKKLLHQLAAFISQNAAFYHHPMVEQWTGAELKYGTGSPRSLIRRAINKTRYPPPNKR